MDCLYSWPLLALLGLVGLYCLSAAHAWHRLRKLPVPHWSAHFSYAWLGRITFGGKQHWTHRTLHEEHGPLVRIGPTEVMTDDPEILRSMSAVRSPFTRADWYLTDDSTLTTTTFSPFSTTRSIEKLVLDPRRATRAVRQTRHSRPA